MPSLYDKSNSFVSGGFHYYRSGDGQSYFREPVQNLETRKYYESHSLKIQLLDNIKSSSMDDVSKLFCEFSVKSTYLEQVLNEYFNNAELLCRQPNPFAELRTPTSEQKKIWSDRGGKVKLFSKLSLGQKHQVIKNVKFLIDEDDRKYKKILAKMHKYVTLRNELIHNLFSSTISNDDRVLKINKSIKYGDDVAEYIDILDTVFGRYILLNSKKYYSKQSEEGVL